jgi:hypothetical protein
MDHPVGTVPYRSECRHRWRRRGLLALSPRMPMHRPCERERPKARSPGCPRTSSGDPPAVLHLKSSTSPPLFLRQPRAHRTCWDPAVAFGLAFQERFPAAAYGHHLLRPA